MRKTLTAIVVSIAFTGIAVADPKMDAVAEKIVKMMERVATDIDTNKPDCDKIGTALNKHVDEDVATSKEAKDLDAKMSKKEKEDAQKQMEAKYGARMKAVEAKMKPIASCTKNDKVKAYMAKVEM